MPEIVEHANRNYSWNNRKKMLTETSPEFMLETRRNLGSTSSSLERDKEEAKKGKVFFPFKKNKGVMFLYI